MIRTCVASGVSGMYTRIGFVLIFRCGRHFYVSMQPMEGVARALSTNRGHRVLHRLPPLFSSSIIANGLCCLPCTPIFVVLGQLKFHINRRDRVRTIFGMCLIYKWFVQTPTQKLLSQVSQIVLDACYGRAAPFCFRGVVT